MARLSVEFSRTARKQLLTQSTSVQAMLLRSIAELGREPRPRGCRKLHGSMETYRIRVGYYRIVYQIEDERLVILVVKLGHRKDIYR